MLKHLVALLAAAVALSPAQARPRDERPFIAMGEAADAPVGFSAMCRDQGGCEADAGEIGTAAAPSDLSDRALLRLARKVNGHVNRTVRKRSDQELYGVDERWQAAGTGRRAAGDCEDIALEKRDELRRAGVAPERLLLATVFVSRLGLHTVLIVRLPSGDVVLDSLAARVIAWNRVSYSWLRIQTPGRPTDWRRIMRA